MQRGWLTRKLFTTGARSQQGGSYQKGLDVWDVIKQESFLEMDYRRHQGVFKKGFAGGRSRQKGTKRRITIIHPFTLRGIHRNGRSKRKMSPSHERNKAGNEFRRRSLDVTVRRRRILIRTLRERGTSFHQTSVFL
ncbi:hypothetical protein SESBI_03617 [Sesbania bispinosa]|nr:hypothetical protein SESBI_03617 [Sesbania bispinosa]